MTRQELETRYPLIRPLAGEGSETYLARSETGAIVMVHFLDAAPVAWRGGLLTRLDVLDVERRERILEVLDVDGKGVVVTRFLMDFRSFPDWIGREVIGPEASDSAAADEFERLFGRAAAPPPDALAGGSTAAWPPADSAEEMAATDVFGAIPSPPAADAVVPPGSAAPPSREPDPPMPTHPGGDPVEEMPSTIGSFPALSEREPPVAADSPPPVVPDERPQPHSGESSPLAPRDAEVAGPGEFTRTFLAEKARAGEASVPDPEVPIAAAENQMAASPPAEPAAPAARPPAEPAAPVTPSPAEPGEFTRTFRAPHGPEDAPRGDHSPSPEPPTHPAAAPPPTEPSVPETAPPSEPGEFTRTFGGPRESEEAPQADLFGSPQSTPPLPEDFHRGPSEPHAHEAEPRGEPQQPSPSSEPGEFTRMFRAARPPESAAGGPSAAAPDSEAGGQAELPRVTDAATPPAVPPIRETASPAPPPAAAEPPSAGAEEIAARATPPPVTAPPAAAPPAAAPPAVDEVRPPEPSSAPPPSEPGEFTRMFRAASPPPAAPSSSAEPGSHRAEGHTVAGSDDTVERPRAASEPGEFTRMFRAATPPPAPPSSSASDARPAPPARESGATPPASATPPPGEFTQMFQKLGGSAPPPSAPATPPQPSPGEGLWSRDDSAAEDRYRERLFGGGPAASPGVPAGPPPQQPSPGFDRVPVDPELPPLPSQMAPPRPPPPPTAGEYTRMVAAQSPPPEPRGAVPPAVPAPIAAAAAAPVAAATGAAKARAPRLGPILGLTAVGFGAFALILYLVLKSELTPGPAETPADSVPAAVAPSP